MSKIKIKIKKIKKSIFGFFDLISFHECSPEVFDIPSETFCSSEPAYSTGETALG